MKAGFDRIDERFQQVDERFEFETRSDAFPRWTVFTRAA